MGIRAKLKTMLKSKIDLIQDRDELLTLFRRIGCEIDDTALAAEMVWARIKRLNAIDGIEDDPQKNLITNDNVQEFVHGTRGVKLFFDGEWYINPKFNLKLRPNWIEIINKEE